MRLIWVPAPGSVPNPKVETTKPPRMFLPLYPFNDWFTVKALLWVPVIILAGLIVLPFVDRGKHMSSRTRVVVVVIGLRLPSPCSPLGIKAQLSPSSRTCSRASCDTPSISDSDDDVVGVATKRRARRAPHPDRL